MALLHLLTCFTLVSLASSDGVAEGNIVHDGIPMNEESPTILRSLVDNTTLVYPIVNTTYPNNATYPDNATTTVFINTTAAGPDDQNDSAIVNVVVYKGRFQTLADGCEGPPPVLQAACAGSEIRLAEDNDAANIACEPSLPQDLPEGFQSGLTCRTLCHDGNHVDPDMCASTLYANDGGYSTAEGPWGEVVYYCLGETLDDLDSVFRYLDSGDGSCSWRLLFDNRLYKLAQLGVFCPYDDNHYDNIEAEEGQITMSLSESYPFTFDDTYFECSQGDSAAIDFSGPRQNDVLCAVGQSCAGEDCDVAFHTIHVHADVYHIAEAGCTMTVNSDGQAVPSNPDDLSVEAAEEATLPAGAYTVVFKAGWSMLFKNPDYWYNLDDIECILIGDNLWLPELESEPEPVSPLSITCTNGNITLVETEESPAKSIACEQITSDTLLCSYDSVDWQSFVNTFSAVIYVRIMRTSIASLVCNCSARLCSLLDLICRSVPLRTDFLPQG
jgi:hypothetical protein